MEINRVWEMPNSNTFQMINVKNILYKYMNYDGLISIDPFARDSKVAKYTNDLNTDYKTDYNLEALDFLKIFDTSSVDIVLFDPPYSPRQIMECYQNIGINNYNTKSSFWSDCKNEISRVLKVGGICISFGWNSNGLGINRGFKIIELLNIAHGGMHNDTIVVVEKKKIEQQTLF